ncbi:MAG: DegT/DnrJ/EryC1/StrS family aminotransferase [Candidatus Thorarchaeota archaeon]
MAQMYSEFFASLDSEIETIPEKAHEFHSYHLYVIKLRNPKLRRQVFEELAKRGIYCQIHYIPIYWHPYYRENGFETTHLLKAEDFYERILSIPMYPSLSDEELDFIFQSFNEILK